MCDEDVAALVVDNGSGKFTKYIYLPYPFLVTDRLFSLTFPIALLFLLTFPTYVLLYLSNLRIYCFVLLDLSILFICSHLTDLSNISLYILCSHWPFQYILYILCSHWPFQYILYILCFHWPFKSIYLHIMFSLTFPIYLSPYYVLTDLSNIFLYYSVHCTVQYVLLDLSNLFLYYVFTDLSNLYADLSNISLSLSLLMLSLDIGKFSPLLHSNSQPMPLVISLYLSIYLSVSLSLSLFAPSPQPCVVISVAEPFLKLN